MVLSEEIARDLRSGAIFEVSGERHGLRKIKRLWFDFASGHYIADCGGAYLWTDELHKPWRCKARCLTHTEQEKT